MKSEGSLAELALSKVLNDAGPIFGNHDSSSSSSYSDWMSSYSDDTRLVHMNIPGAHDAATWNYTEETQQSLKHVVELIHNRVSPPDWLRCQTKSLSEMLDLGVRAFDLRYEQDVTRKTLVFWHSSALLSQTATVEDVLFAFYAWLDRHPTEVVFLSFQKEGSMGDENAAETQAQMFEALTSEVAKRYILQTRDDLGTLGEARGKIILLKRFVLDHIPAEQESQVPGLHFKPDDEWPDNSADFTVVYSSKHDGTGNGTAIIEDYYGPDTAPSSTLHENIEIKLTAIQNHLSKAASNDRPNALFWGFASGKNVRHDTPMTPRKMAIGEEEVLGTNRHLVDFLKQQKGKRLGIVMFDFAEVPSDLLPLFLSLKGP